MTAKSLEAQGIQGPRVEKTGSQKLNNVALGTPNGRFLSDYARTSRVGSDHEGRHLPARPRLRSIDRQDPRGRPDQPCSDVDYVEAVVRMFEISIEGTIHTTLDALSQRWGGSKGDVIKSLSHIGATTAVDVLIPWPDQAVRIVRLFVGPTWGAFGSQPL